MDPDLQTTPERLQQTIPVVTPEDNPRSGGAVNPNSGGAEANPNETPPSIRSAITEIGNFRFNPELDNTTMAELETAKAFALMMNGPTRGSMKYTEKIDVGEWPYKGKTPDPINIAKAVKLLAAAYRKIDCDTKGAGTHGFAWIIEDNKKWLARNGTSLIQPPTRPVRVTGYDMKQQWEYRVKLQDYELYRDLAKQGVKKILEWFGKEVFCDLFEDESELPPDITPRELIDHIKTTYADESKERDCVRAARKIIEETAFNPKARYPVEECCLAMQEAQAEIQLLGRAYDDASLMDAAINHFRNNYSLKDVRKAEDKWDKETKRDWSAFKIFWKQEIRKITDYNSSTSKKKFANEVEVEDVGKLQAIIRENELLKRQRAYEQQYYQDLEDQASAAQESTRADIRTNDDQSIVSAMTTMTTTMTESTKRNTAAMEAMMEMMRQLQTSCNATTKTVPTAAERNQEKLHIAKYRNPKDFKNVNNGNGRYFNSYCWLCGVNCTHGTRACRELSQNEQKKYKSATHTNTMGGSTKFIERWGKPMKDYNFDSL